MIKFSEPQQGFIQDFFVGRGGMRGNNVSVLPSLLPLSDENLARLMRIAIEGPEPEYVDFNAILDIFKQSNR